MSSSHPHDSPTRASGAVVLVLSPDAVAAALLGALLETLGYTAHFARRAERAPDAMRRVRPRACLGDCDDDGASGGETVGRAAMRGIAVVLFGTPAALERRRDVIGEFRLETLTMPPDPADLDAVVRRAIARLD